MQSVTYIQGSVNGFIATPWPEWLWYLLHWMLTLIVYHVYHLCIQCRRLHGARGDTCPHFYKWLGSGAPWVGEQRTRNWPNCSHHHEIAHKTTNCAFRAKTWRGTTKKNFFPALRAASVPHFRSGPVPPLSNSFRRHCLYTKQIFLPFVCLKYTPIHKYTIPQIFKTRIVANIREWIFTDV